MKLYLVSFLSFFLLIPSAFAHCPLCTAATGAAVAVTRFYGLDDSIVGVFVGGMVIATGLWINNLLKKYNKGKEFLPLQSVIVLLVSFILTIITLYFANLVGPANPFKILGIDRILFGTIIGIALSYFSFRFHSLLRVLNKDKNFFPYQSIAVLILYLVIGAATLYVAM